MAQIKDYTEKTTPTGTDEFIFQETAGGLTKKITHTNFLKTLQAEVDALEGVDVTTQTDNYTVPDLTGRELIIFADSSNRAFNITLPTLVDNQNKRIKIISSDLGGKITIDGEGAETIGGYTSLALQSKNDHLEVIGESGEWQIMSYSAKYDTGWINTNDYTSRQLGTSSFDYDNLSGSFTVGETITEATSNNTGIIQSDTGSILTVKNVTGTGIWTNNRQITGSTSGSTADVNEGSGSNKNQDTDIFHDLNFNISELSINFLLSTDGTDNNSLQILDTAITNGVLLGETLYQIDANNFTIESGAAGILIGTASGGFQVIDSENWYYKIIAGVKI